MKASLKKWMDRTHTRIRDGLLGEGEIRVLRQRAADATNKRDTPDDVRHAYSVLCDAVYDHAPHVTREQARKGAGWLYAKTHKPDRTPRNNAFVRDNFNDDDLQIIRELYFSDTPEFALVGFEDVGSRGYVVFAPIYRAFGLSGSFDYVAVAWQSGGQSFVRDHATAVQS